MDFCAKSRLDWSCMLRILVQFGRTPAYKFLESTPLNLSILNSANLCFASQSPELQHLWFNLPMTKLDELGLMFETANSGVTSQSIRKGSVKKLDRIGHGERLAWRLPLMPFLWHLPTWAKDKGASRIFCKELVVADAKHKRSPFDLCWSISNRKCVDLLSEACGMRLQDMLLLRKPYTDIC